MSESAQIKSRKRVRDHGEVFTAPREVNAMLDLCKDASYSIAAKFLEPACGNGNFLVEILRRKLFAVCGEAQRTRATEDEWQVLAARAVASIYAIDILADNVAESKARLADIVAKSFAKNCPTAVADNARAVRFLGFVRQILDANIVQGDFLTGKNATAETIKFYDWEKENKTIRLTQDVNCK